MIDRRTFLKLSAGALVLTAAGALTGCGDTVVDKTSGVAKIGDVTFICATPFLGGGDNFALTYCTEFTVQNNSAEKVVIKPEDITSKKRNSEFVQPRQVVMYLCRELTDTSLINVGKILGKKDHTTVMHGVKKIETEIQTNEELKNKIDIIIKKINPS